MMIIPHSFFTITPIIYAPAQPSHKWLESVFVLSWWSQCIIYCTYLPSYMRPPITLWNEYIQILLFPFWIIIILGHVNKIPRILPIWYIPSQIHIWLQNNHVFVTYYLTSTSLLHKPHLHEYKIPRVLCHLLFDIHILTTQKPTFHPL